MHRFIPASAGNMSSQRKSVLRSSVHPRVCGEHTSYNLLINKSVFKELKSTDKISCKRRVFTFLFFRQERHKFDAVKLYRNSPVRPQSHKIKPRLRIRVPRHYHIAFPEPFFNILPDRLPNPPADIAYNTPGPEVSDPPRVLFAADLATGGPLCQEKNASMPRNDSVPPPPSLASCSAPGIC